MNRTIVVALTVAGLAILFLGVARAQECTPGMTFGSDVTIPDDTVMQPNEVFTKTWQLKNSGICDWTTKYALKLVDGDPLSTSGPLPLFESVKAGDTADVHIVMAAPGVDGTYTSWWQLIDDAQKPVGSKFYVRIAVGAADSEKDWIRSKADKTLTYRVVEKSPDRYKNEIVCWRGRIFNIEEDDGLTIMQLFYEDGFDAFLVWYEGLLDLYKNDTVETCGYISGEFTGENLYGAEISQPLIEGLAVTK